MADPRLFDPGPKQRPDRNYDPNQWVKSPDVVWHSSASATPPKPTPQPVPPGDYTMQSAEHYRAGAMHVGTLKAAMEREHAYNKSKALPKREHLHPYALSGQFAPPPGRFFSADPPGTESPRWADDPANDPGNTNPQAVSMLRRGKNIAYRNAEEDVGSTSFITTRPENLSTWSESTLADPNAPRHLRALAEHYELTGKRTGTRSRQSMTRQLTLDESTFGREPVQQGGWHSHPPGTVGVSEHIHPVANVLQRKY